MADGIRLPFREQVGFEELFSGLLAMKANGVKGDFLGIRCFAKGCRDSRYLLFVNPF